MCILVCFADAARELRYSPTKQPVGIQDLRGFGNALDHICLAAATKLLLLTAWSSSMPIILEHLEISGSCMGLYTSEI